jgi:hypothetical protein
MTDLMQNFTLLGNSLSILALAVGAIKAKRK